MTEQDKNFIVRLWDSGEPMTSIIRLIPYETKVAKSMIAELRQNGTLQGRSGKSWAKTKDKVLKSYNKGICNPYDLAEEHKLTVGTIRTILATSGLHRKKPKHNYKPYPLSEETLAIVTDIQSGKKFLEIAKAHGTSRQYIYKVNKKYVAGWRNAE